MKLILVIPGLRLFNPNNRNAPLPLTGRKRNHWRAERAEVDAQKAFVRLALAQVPDADRDELRAAPAVRVRFVRVGGRRMDSGGVCSAVKWVEDEVAAWLRPGLPAGRADDPKYGVRTEYPPQQEDGEPGLRIELESLEDVS